MSQKRLLIAASIIGLIIVGSFALSVPHTRDVITAAAVHTPAAVPVVTVRDVFKKGTHTITGSVIATNACSIVTAETSLVGEATSTRHILLAVTESADSGVCLQIPTRMTFSTSLAAPALMPLSVTVNGVTATATSS